MRHRTELQQLTIDGTHEVVAVRDLSPKWGGSRKGAGRPRGDQRTKTISVRISEEIDWHLRVAAKKTGMGVAEFVRMAIDETAKRYMPEDWL